MPQFNIVIPCYNVAAYIEECLDSVAKSLEQDYQIIAVDDCSTDNTFDILQTYQKNDSRITALRNAKNLNNAGTRDAAFPYLTAPYTLYIDSDDTISPYLLTVAKAELENHNADIAYFKYLYISADGSYLSGGVQPDGEIIAAKYPDERQFFFNEPMPWCKLYRTSLLKENNIRFAHADVAHADVAHNIISVICAKSIVQIQAPLYYYRKHSSSIVANKDAMYAIGAVTAYREAKESIVSRGFWETWKENFLVYKIRHSVWVWNNINPAHRRAFISAFAQSMDKEEQDFYRTRKFPPEFRDYIKANFGILDSSSANTYPAPYPFQGAKPADMQSHPEFWYNNDWMTVHNWSVRFGRLGINVLGFGDPLVLPKPFSVHSHVVMSGHCPSEIRVTFKAKTALVGLLNGTSPPDLTSGALFFINGKHIKTLYGPLEQTPELVLEPGTYLLETRAINPSGKHTLWAAKEYSGVLRVEEPPVISVPGKVQELPAKECANRHQKKPRGGAKGR